MATGNGSRLTRHSRPTASCRRRRHQAVERGTARATLSHGMTEPKQPWRRAQRQPVHCRQRRHRQNGRVTIRGRRAPPVVAYIVMPSGERRRAHPPQQTSALDSHGVILAPVAQVVLGFACLSLPTARLPANPPARLLVQSTSGSLWRTLTRYQLK